MTIPQWHLIYIDPQFFHALIDIVTITASAKQRTIHQWDEEWGRIRFEGNLWYLGSIRQNWESVMGHHIYEWLRAYLFPNFIFSSSTIVGSCTYYHIATALRMGVHLNFCVIVPIHSSRSFIDSFILYVLSYSTGRPQSAEWHVLHP